MQEWDNYWAKNRQPQNRFYNRIAVFYRKYIIKPYLNYYLTSYFPEKSIILHAGCGSGQVEEGITGSVSTIGLDISMNALDLYKEFHIESELILGDISSLGIKNEKLDGIYNLGVMEHFDDKSLDQILLEFHRVLKKKGIVILFWPPEYGLTVIILRGVHFFLNRVLRKNIHLHPPEPNLIKSKKFVKKLVENAGFTIREINFSIGDLFTQMVVVLEKKE